MITGQKGNMKLILCKSHFKEKTYSVLRILFNMAYYDIHPSIMGHRTPNNLLDTIKYDRIQLVSLFNININIILLQLLILFGIRHLQI